MYLRDRRAVWPGRVDPERANGGELDPGLPRAMTNVVDNHERAPFARVLRLKSPLGSWDSLESKAPFDVRSNGACLRVGIASAAVLERLHLSALNRPVFIDDYAADVRARIDRI